MEVFEDIGFINATSNNMKTSIALYFIALLCLGCGKTHQPLDTTTSGSISIAADDALTPIIKQELSAFENMYKKARVNLRSCSEAEAIDLLLKDSVRLIAITRPLSTTEEQTLAAQKITPHTITLATTAVALIVHPNNPDSVVTLDEIKAILGGKRLEIEDLKLSKVVFDHQTSGIVRFLRDSLGVQEPLSNHCFALNDNKGVIDYVASERSSLGIIDLSWISDFDDSLTDTFLKDVKVMAVQKDKDAYKPYQAYLATGDYPLVRKVYVISREARAGLGSGLMAYMAGEKGQRIILKSGLVPATMPIRIVRITKQSITD